jgi:hypothetical protein
MAPAVLDPLNLYRCTRDRSDFGLISDVHGISR